MDVWVGANGFRQVLRILGMTVPGPGSTGGGAFEIESVQALAALERMSVPGVPPSIAARIRQVAVGRDRLSLRLERTGILRIDACGDDKVSTASETIARAA